jgi:hypothetical protein
MIRLREEINAVAVPTEFIEYNLAAITQKRKPAEAFRILLRTENMEFL